MSTVNKKSHFKSALKRGPVIYQADDTLLEEDRLKKDLALSELNHAFKIYLKRKGIRKKDVSIVGQFAVIFNDRRFAKWWSLSKVEQCNALTDVVIMPAVYKDLISLIGDLAGNAWMVETVVKDAFQNAIDSFSHAAYVQKKYVDRFPGFKVVLFLDQNRHLSILTVVDNGFGEKVTKPKKSHTGHEYGNDLVSRLSDWLVRRYVEKEGPVIREIAYTGGQGMAMKKLQNELHLKVDLLFFSTGTVFELELPSFF